MTFEHNTHTHLFSQRTSLLLMFLVTNSPTFSPVVKVSAEHDTPTKSNKRLTRKEWIAVIIPCRFDVVVVSVRKSLMMYALHNLGF